MEKFNIVIGTHGRFGEELVKSASMIAGDMSHVKTCSLLPEYSFEEYMKVVDSTLSTLDDGFTIVLVIYMVVLHAIHLLYCHKSIIMMY